jgi:hypothetical protein
VLLVGIAIYVVPRWLFPQLDATYQKGTDHLSLAVMIAAIVGFGYEWAAHDKKIEELVEDLNTLVHEDAKEAFPRVVELMFQKAEAVKGVSRAKGQIDPHDQLKNDLVTLASSIAILDEHDWAAHFVSIEFISKIVNYASEAAANLAGAASTNQGEYTLTLPARAEKLADEILANQMDALQKNESFDVISDFSSWRPQTLDQFEAARIRAMSRNVRVRRVFCYFTHDSCLPVSEVKRILREHWDQALASQHGGKACYEVALCSDLCAAYPHVGIFSTKGQKVCFSPTSGKGLSEFRFLRASAAQLFEDCWRRATAVTKGQAPTDLSLILGSVDERWWSRFEGSTPGPRAVADPPPTPAAAAG